VLVAPRPAVRPWRIALQEIRARQVASDRVEPIMNSDSGRRAAARRALGLCLLGALAVGCGSSTAKSDGGSGGSGGSAGHGAIGSTGGAEDGGKTDGPSTCPPPELVTDDATSGTMSWRDDGTLECAQIIEVTHILTSTTDALVLNASAINGTMLTGVLLDLTNTDGTTLGGTYHCNADGGVYAAINYTGTGVSDPPLDCTITIANPGASTDHAQGTFSLTLATEGGTKQVTAGTFDIVLKPTGG
jgi:hypothetical protein